MSKYTVRHSCGHDREYQLFGKAAERERKLDWLATLPCPRCRNEAEGPIAYVTRHLHDGADQATIDIVNSFAVKDVLKSRGYRFGKERVVRYEGSDLLKAATIPPVPAWFINLEPQQIDDELGWIREQGWAVVERSGLLSAFGAVLEGKSEAVNPEF